MVKPFKIARITYRNKKVRKTPFVLQPRIAILGTAPLNVSRSAVGNHADEEERVEPGERAPIDMLGKNIGVGRTI
jgi:hypothetical protein